MENEFTSSYDDPEEPIVGDKEANGCVIILWSVTVVAVIAIAWAFYELLTF